MNDLKNNLLAKDISTLFGFDELTDDEKVTLLDDIGEVIIESAVLRFMVECSEEDADRFEKMTAEHAAEEKVLPILIESFPRFGELLEEEIASFKEEAVAVLDTAETSAP